MRCGTSTQNLGTGGRHFEILNVLTGQNGERASTTSRSGMHESCATTSLKNFRQLQMASLLSSPFSRRARTAAIGVRSGRRGRLSLQSCGGKRHHRTRDLLVCNICNICNNAKSVNQYQHQSITIARCRCTAAWNAASERTTSTRTPAARACVCHAI